MSLKQKNVLLTSAIVVFALGVLILLLGIFPVWGIRYSYYDYYFYNLYYLRIILIPAVSLVITCPVMLILSILIKVNVIKKTKGPIITYGIANALYAATLVAFIVEGSKIVDSDRYYNGLGIFIFVLSGIICLLAIVSSFLAFKFQFFPSTKEVIKDQNAAKEDVFANIEKLKSLKELLDKGIITEEEFEEKKKRYLEGL